MYKIIFIPVVSYVAKSLCFINLADETFRLFGRKMDRAVFEVK